jgi:hypothetical protein
LALKTEHGNLHVDQRARDDPQIDETLLIGLDGDSDGDLRSGHKQIAVSVLKDVGEKWVHIALDDFNAEGEARTGRVPVQLFERLDSCPQRNNDASLLARVPDPYVATMSEARCLAPLIDLRWRLAHGVEPAR